MVSGVNLDNSENKISIVVEESKPISSLVINSIVIDDLTSIPSEEQILNYNKLLK